MELDKTCRKLAKILDEDYDTVKNIVLYEFKYTVDTMKDPDNTMDILFNKLFKFKLKSRFKENKNKDYSPKL